MERLHSKNAGRIWQLTLIALAIGAVFFIGKAQNEPPKKPSPAKTTSAQQKQPEQEKKPQEITPTPIPTETGSEQPKDGIGASKKEATQAAPTIPNDTQNERLLILGKERESVTQRLILAKQELSQNPNDLALKNATTRLEADASALNREISLLIDKKQSVNNLTETVKKNNPTVHVTAEKSELEYAPSHGGKSEEKPHFEAWDIFRNYGHKKEIQDESN